METKIAFQPNKYRAKLMHIAFCINDAYCSYIAVTIKSIAETNSGSGGIVIHVLTDHFSKRSYSQLQKIVNGYKGFELHIHKIDDTPLKGLETGKFTIYNWYRVLLPEILPNDIEKVLYLDADTVVTDDLSDLFSLDMTGKAIAGTLDSLSLSKEPYIRCGYDSRKLYVCSGVLLMNTTYWRKHRLTDKIIDWARLNPDRIKFADQDAINYICQDDKIVLPLRYNVVNYFFSEKDYIRSSYIKQLKECIQHPAIIHYAGWYPWIKDGPQHSMCNVWLRYNNMLNHPAKRKYQSKGWTLLKIRIWDLFHPEYERIVVTIADIERDLLSIS